MLNNARKERFYPSDFKGRLSGTPLQIPFNDKLTDANKGKEAPKVMKKDEAKKAGWSSLLSDAGDELDKEIKRIDELLDEAYEAAEKAIEKKEYTKENEEQKEKDLDNLHLAYRKAQRLMSERRRDVAEKVREIRGDGIFESFVDYQWSCITNAVKAVRYGNITGGMDGYQNAVRGRAIQPVAVPKESDTPYQGATVTANDRQGFLYWVLMTYHGFVWLLCVHWVYATILLIVLMAVWALFGGAIHRIAALHAAREEKISMCQALRFSAGKFGSFFTAPLIPLGVILFCGGLLALGGFAFGNYLGGIFMGLLFLLALPLGLVIAFLLTGLVAGGSLMYPTIAVEGSDSFDAISRSFSYVMARPFRAVFYGLAALVYGVVTYLFVRLFAFLMLASMHMFIKWGVFASGDAVSPDADKLDVIWTAPKFDSLIGPFSWSAMRGTESVGAFMIGIWVFLVAGMVAAYLVSYFASSTTIVYLLIRRKVDATDLDDVYVEEAEEEPVGEAAEEATPGEQAPSQETETPKEEGGKEEKAKE